MSDSNHPDFDCQVAAGLLESGRTIAHVANAAAVIAGIGCWLARGPALPLLFLSLTLWLVQTWFAARVAIDRSLFQTLAHDPASGPGRLDALLIEWKLRERKPVDWELVKTPQSRSMADRIQGALRLWRMQSAALALQLLTLGAAVALRWVNA